MRSWSYTYKTSDGIRHEAVMSAASKDEVYEALRKQGIRAIKVTERIAPVIRKGLRGLRKRDWAILAVAAILASAAVGFFLRSSAPASPTSAGKRTRVVPPSPAFIRISAVARQLQDAHQRAELSIDRDLFGDLERIRTATNLAPFRAEIEKGRALVANSRRNVKRVYFPLYRALSAERQDEQREAQRLYGVLMGEIDTTESWLDETEFLLDQVLFDGSGGNKNHH